jgi:oligopeptide/dipeptide ABC transporter ATP-binding protein
MSEPLLEVTGLHKSFPLGGGLIGGRRERVKAVAGVSFDVAPGETLALVGESGSGKSTTARLVLRLLKADAGSIRFEGTDLLKLRGRQLREARREMQMVFQDPYSSLDPSWTVGDIIGEPLRIHHGVRGRELEERAVELLRQVSLDPSHVRRYPYEFSGGQRQRIAIARALALRPRLIVCDEPVSALDVSTQASVITLLQDLQEELGLSYLFIAHDLAVVRRVSTRIAVMYLGSIVEMGPAEQVYQDPRHPYSQALLAAIPLADPRRQRARRRLVAAGDIPNPVNPPAGCAFHPRCPFVMDICRTVTPALEAAGPGRLAACHLVSSGEGVKKESA